MREALDTAQDTQGQGGVEEGPEVQAIYRAMREAAGARA